MIQFERVLSVRLQVESQVEGRNLKAESQHTKARFTEAALKSELRGEFYLPFRVILQDFYTLKKTSGHPVAQCPKEDILRTKKPKVTKTNCT